MNQMDRLVTGSWFLALHVQRAIFPHKINYDADYDEVPSTLAESTV